MLQTDPTQWVNQHSQVIKNLNVLDREVHSSSELGVFVQSHDAFDAADRHLRRRLHARAARATTPTRCSPRRGSSSTVSQLSDVPGAQPPRAHLAPTSAAPTTVAPHDIQLSTVSPSTTP